jgi:hypothetical protein
MPNGGGGGIVGVGNSFTGPSQLIDIIGDHCLALSGNIEVNNVTADMLSFKTGNYYTVCSFQHFTNRATSDNFEFRIYLNGKSVLELEYTQPTLVYPVGQSPYNLIIPAYTEVLVQMQNVTGTDGHPSFVVMTGRIYRG